MIHKLKHYKDGYNWVAFCRICGKEDEELFDKCEPIEPVICDHCGHTVCQCEEIRKKFRLAVDKSKLRN